VRRQTYGEGETIFAQGQSALSLFYICSGKVRKTRVSTSGKTRVIAVLGPQEFFGTKCVIDAGSERECTVSAMTNCSVACIDRTTMVRALREEPDVAEMFISSLIDRAYQYEGDLVSHLFNSSEQRLARTLMGLSEGLPKEGSLPKISQEVLAEIVGTTRPRINQFLKKFHRLGLIEHGRTIRVLPGLSEAYRRSE
jgi:CRP-like cAMP-binding protein